MTHIRPIQTDELSTFIATATDSKHVGEIRQYVDGLLANGAIRTDWCYFAERDGHPIGRGAFYTLPNCDHPSALVLLDLPWQSEAASDVGTALLQEMLSIACSLGADQLEYVIDTPVQRPQWQVHPDRRASLVEQHGFRMIRKTVRFELERGEARHQLSADHDVQFRSMTDVGENAFIDTIRRVSAASLDQQIRAQREKLGKEDDAREHFKDLTTLEYDPTWWEVAYTPDDDLVGVTVPIENPTSAAIGYIGVVPEMRGQGYVDTLLARGTATLVESGAERIIADTDVGNIPMANAFRRAGYSQFAIRHEYSVSLRDERPRT